jgi:hypothetical protein
MAIQRPETSKQRVRRAAVALFGDDVGCSDGHCVFGHPGGMHTNGGCKCWRDLPERTACRMLGTIALHLAAEALTAERDQEVL